MSLFFIGIYFFIGIKSSPRKSRADKKAEEDGELFAQMMLAGKTGKGGGKGGGGDPMMGIHIRDIKEEVRIFTHGRGIFTHHGRGGGIFRHGHSY